MAQARKSNYEVMRDQMAASFLLYDQNEMVRKFSLEADAQFLFIDFFANHYRINRESGVVMRHNPTAQLWEMADYNEVMTIYDVLCYSKKDCHASGSLRNLSALSSIQGGSLAKGGNFYQNAGTYFAGKGAELARACEAMGGIRDGVGDVGYRLDMFPFLPVAVHFWDADEDFPVSLQILVDRSILDFMHFETVMFAVGHLLERLKKLSCAT